MPKSCMHTACTCKTMFLCSLDIYILKYSVAGHSSTANPPPSHPRGSVDRVWTRSTERRAFER